MFSCWNHDGASRSRVPTNAPIEFSGWVGPPPKKKQKQKQKQKQNQTAWTGETVAENYGSILVLYINRFVCVCLSVCECNYKRL